MGKNNILPPSLQSFIEENPPEAVEIHPHRGTGGNNLKAFVDVLYAGIIFNIAVHKAPNRNRATAFLSSRRSIKLPNHDRTLAKILQAAAIEAWEAQEAAEKEASDVK